MVSEATLKSFTDLATAFVNVDWQLEDDMSSRAEALAASTKVEYEDAFQILREGAILFKLRSLIRGYEEAREEASQL